MLEGRDKMFRSKTQVVRSLIIDELVHVKANPFRVRVWAGEGKSTICLTSQVVGGPPPDVCKANLANLVVSGLLYCRLPLPSFYEASVQDKPNNGNPLPSVRVYRVTYEVYGHGLRPVLNRPTYAPLSVIEFTSSLLVSTGTMELF